MIHHTLNINTKLRDFFSEFYLKQFDYCEFVRLKLQQPNQKTRAHCYVATMAANCEVRLTERLDRGGWQDLKAGV